MAWIKRNLLFVAGGAVALLLLGVAAFYLISNLSSDTAVTEELNQQISELRNMYNAPAHPGTDTLDNISAAKADEKRVSAFLGDAQKLFAPVPIHAKTDDKGFNNLLLTTIRNLQTGASNAGVTLPPDYSFTFLAQRGKLQFATNSIEPWTIQLGEIKTIANILYAARVNAIDGMKRVPVSVDDVAGNPEYMQGAITTNDVTITTPYEVTFRSFSDEIATVMNGFLRSTNSMVVKSVSVLPATGIPGSGEGMTGYGREFSSPTPFPSSRYGGIGGFGGRGEGRGFFPPNQPQPGTVANPTVPTVFLSEKSLQVTLLVHFVKLKPQQ